MGQSYIWNDEAIQARLNELASAESQCNREISALKTAMYQVQTQLTTISNKITELTNKQTEYTNLKISLETLKADLDALSSSINGVVTNLNNMGEGNVIDGILTKLGQRGMTVGAKIDAINSINASIDAKLKSIQDELKRLNSQKDYLTKEIERNQQIIANKETMLSGIREEVKSLVTSY